MVNSDRKMLVDLRRMFARLDTDLFHLDAGAIRGISMHV
jgi:hypothetical protein